MIERKFIKEKLKEYQIEQYVGSNLRNVGHSHTKMVKTPLGEKIVIFASRPGLIVGRKGQNIKELTKTLKKKFNLENPQIEISEVENIHLDAKIVAERITDSMERFGSEKFKAIGHKTMEEIMNAGALGVEIIVSGKIPSSRAKSWRFYQGYLKKCGDIAISGVSKAMSQACLKTGVVGVKVSIMPPDTVLPDRVELLEEKQTIVEEIKEGEEKESDDKKEEKESKEKAEKKPAKKKKAATKKEKETENKEEVAEDKSEDAVEKKSESKEKVEEKKDDEAKGN